MCFLCGPDIIAELILLANEFVFAKGVVTVDLSRATGLVTCGTVPEGSGVWKASPLGLVDPKAVGGTILLRVRVGTGKGSVIPAL